MNFCSDNVSGMHPRILEALIAGNDGDVLPYGADPHTKRAETRFRDVFERDLAVAMVATGTASNALAMSLVASPVSAIFCRAGAHLQESEAGAARLAPLTASPFKENLLELAAFAARRTY